MLRLFGRFLFSQVRACNHLDKTPPLHLHRTPSPRTGPFAGRSVGRPFAADSNRDDPPPPPSPGTVVTTDHREPGEHASEAYVRGMYDAWQSDRTSVSPAWAYYFLCRKAGVPSCQDFQPDASALFLPNNNWVVFVPDSDHVVRENERAAEITDKTIADDCFAVQSVVAAHQTRGHLVARLNPLRPAGANVVADERAAAAVLYQSPTPPYADADLNRGFELPPTTMIGGRGGWSLPLREIVRRLKYAYCRTIGVEYAHVDSPGRCEWIRREMEVPGKKTTSADRTEKIRILHRLMRASEFEAFSRRKWAGEKRCFGLAGCESLIPAMMEIVDRSSAHGVNSIVVGMPRRGRLNVMANVCQQPLHTVFAQFRGLEAEGDIKYHLGTDVERVNEVTDKKVRITLVANPPRLEAVNPMVQGKTRAEQLFKSDVNGKEVMSILLHGDSSFCGQGTIYETFRLSELPDYSTHGTIHIVVNNQIGFTSDPKVSRSSSHCTDVARAVNAPIFHVNADDPEAVIRVCKIAVEWRSSFGKDIVIDLVGYQRNGHHEVDEPMFTQPHVSKVIQNTVPVFDKYAKSLINENVVTEEEVKKAKEDYRRICEEAYLVSTKETGLNYGEWLGSLWQGIFKSKNLNSFPKTGVKEDILKHVGNSFSLLPPNGKEFVVDESIEMIFKNRRQMIQERYVDWTMAEAMSFGSLLRDGTHVRLSGEDVESGTFSHRHHVLYDRNVENSTYRPLCNLYPDQAPYTVCNSSLSEFVTLGFELGYSMANPNSLVCWEAQFGDANSNAQCVIDIISSGEANLASSDFRKKLMQSGLVMLLPYGYEGMGPEHSAARLERFLQMSSDDPGVLPPSKENFAINQLRTTNLIIANCSTPANYFHILRRQIALPFRKPLIVVTPKSLLRHPEAKSSFDDMTENTEFQRIIPENGIATKNMCGVERLIFCSGKVYYDLIKERDERNLSEVIAICRVEQILPFPSDLVDDECAKYNNAAIIWAQEEPKNQGAWSYVQPRLSTVIRGSKLINYAGGPTAALSATDNKILH